MAHYEHLKFARNDAVNNVNNKYCKIIKNYNYGLY